MRLWLSRRSIVRERGKEKENTEVTPKPKGMFKERSLIPLWHWRGNLGWILCPEIKRISPRALGTHQDVPILRKISTGVSFLTSIPPFHFREPGMLLK